MPTVHLSMPDKLYRELKEAAESYGIQVTDLIKIIVRANLALAKNGKIAGGAVGEEVSNVKERLEKLENEFIEEKQRIECMIRSLVKMLKSLEERVDELELELEEVKERVGLEKPYIEPELIEE